MLHSVWQRLRARDATRVDLGNGACEGECEGEGESEGEGECEGEQVKVRV